MIKADKKKTSSIFGYSLFVMFISHTLTHVAGSIRDTIMPVLRDEFSLSNQQVGLIAAIPPLCTTLITIPAGILTDRYGAKKLMASAIIMAFVGAFIAGITKNVPMFILATTLLTLNAAFFHPPASSWIARNARPKNISKAMGVFDAGGTFGFGLGPFSITILMGILAFSWRQSYLFWVLPISLSLIAIYYVKSETEETILTKTKKDETVTKPKLLSTSMILFLISSGIRRFGGSMTLAFLSIYLVESRGWQLALVGLMLGVGRLMGLFASPIGGILSSRFGDKKWMSLSLLTSYVFFLIAFLVKGIAFFIAFYLFHRFFQILSMPASGSITAKLSPRGQRGMGFALSFLPGSVMRAIAPVVAAFIADYLGFFPIFITSIFFLFIGLGVFQFGVKID